jgi:hypothetical protein
MSCNHVTTDQVAAKWPFVFATQPFGNVLLMTQAPFASYNMSVLSVLPAILQLHWTQCLPSSLPADNQDALSTTLTHQSGLCIGVMSKHRRE